MPDICPECGAAWTKNRTCQSAFDEFLVLEYTDPEYGIVHMLTVACFMIQHGRYSDEGLVWIERRLREHIEKGMSMEEIRRKMGGETDQIRRRWKVVRQPGDLPQRSIPWTMTIMDVAGNMQDASSYRDLIKQWAITTLREMQPLLVS
jgi:hypothetical protein